MITSRCSLFGFGAALIAAPAIVRVASIMPISAPKYEIRRCVMASVGSFYMRNDGPHSIYVSMGASEWVEIGPGESV